MTAATGWGSSALAYTHITLDPPNKESEIIKSFHFTQTAVYTNNTIRIPFKTVGRLIIVSATAEGMTGRYRRGKITSQ